MNPTRPIQSGAFGRSLLVLWALALTLVAVPCGAVAGMADDCGHCTDHAAGHAGDTCLQCDTDALAGPVPADDRGPAAGPLAQAPAASVVLVAATRPAPRFRAAPRPPAVQPYLTTRRLRL